MRRPLTGLGNRVLNPTVLITSVGTASAINVLKALRRQTELLVSIVAVDADPSAAGLYLTDRRHVVPDAHAADYIPRLTSLLRSEHVDVLIPIHSGEIEIIARHRSTLERAGARMLLSEPSVIALCNDKARLARVAGEAGIRTPRVFSLPELENLPESRFPLFSKPQMGSSSRGAAQVKNRIDLEYFRMRNPDYLFQEFVDGPEITIDVLVDSLHRPLVISPRARLATKDGQSVKGVTLENGPYRSIVTTLAGRLQLVGPCNIQFIRRGSELVLIEVNPRYAAGGLMLTVHAGANIPLLAVKATLGLPISENECRATEGKHMSRYWEEVFW